MLPMLDVRLALGELLAADVATLAPVAANEMVLISQPFVMDENAVIGDLAFATFTGSNPIAGVAGTQLVGIDPTTNDQIITLKTPAGGWHWETTDAVNLPQTIYGAALTDGAGATLLGLLALPTPIALTAGGQIVDLGTIILTIVTQPMS